jgi:hypothetical protein
MFKSLQSGSAVISRKVCNHENLFNLKTHYVVEIILIMAAVAATAIQLTSISSYESVNIIK